MARNRKPKKALVQMGIALAIAVVLGIAGILSFVGIINAINVNKEKMYAEELATKEQLEQQRLEDQRRIAELEKKLTQETNSEVQAIQDIPSGQPITKDMVTLVETEDKPGAQAMTRLSEVVGKIATSNILAGEAITRSKITRSDGMIQVKEGQRAITVSVNSIGGVDGAINPGSIVDVLTTIQDKSHGEITKTLLQGVKVIAVGGGTNEFRKNDRISSVTLAVTPGEAEMLTLANHVGEFHLTLRNYKDAGIANVNGADITQLLTGLDGSALQAPNLPPPPEVPDLGMVPVSYEGQGLPNPPDPAGFGEQQHTMEIYRGSGSETVVFE